ncbi:MAG: HEAT repeat domain-containing protein [Candidatus Altiarchaeota archaeon]
MVEAQKPIQKGSEMPKPKELGRVDDLIRRLGGSHWEAVKAMKSLDALGDEVVPQLLEAASSDKPTVRGNAIAVLGLKKDGKHLSLFEEALEDEGDYVVKQAVVAVERTAGLDEADRIIRKHSKAKTISMMDRPENVSKDNPEYVRTLGSK